MPTIKLPTAVGIVPFQYTISTPTNSNADQIDPTLPTIVFLHGDFFPSETMHRACLLAIPLHIHIARY